MVGIGVLFGHMPTWWPIPIASAFLLAAWLTPVVRAYALRLGVVDGPDGGRKKHAAPVPLFGGIAIAIAFVVPIVVVLFGSNVLTSGDITSVHYGGLVVGIVVLTAWGVYDDRYRLSAKFAMIAFACASLIAVLSGIEVSKLTNPFGGVIVLAPFAASAVAFVWILAMTMTTKLLDGVDGLAASIATIAAILIAALALTPTYFQSDVALLALVFAAAVAGFLVWNWHPAQIFLGETGSTVLGFTIGVLSVISGSKIATALLVLGIPAIDVALVAWRRYRAGNNPFTTADRGHFHFLLLDRGVSPRMVVFVYCGIATLFGVSTLIFVSWQKALALGILFGASIIGITLFAKRV